MANPQTIGDLREKAAKDPNSLTLDEVKALGQLRKLNPSGDERWLCTRQEAAELLGMTPQGLDKAVERGNLQRATRGRIDVREICRLLRERAEQGTEKDELKDVQIRYREAKARLSEIEVDIREGRLLSRDDISRALLACGTTFRNGLNEWVLTLPDKITRKGKKQVVKVLREEIEKVLRQLSEQLVAIGDDENN